MQAPVAERVLTQALDRDQSQHMRRVDRHAVKALLPNLSGLKKTQEENHSLRDQIKSLQDEIKTLQANAKEQDSMIAQLKSEAEKLNAAIAELRKETDNG